MIPRLLRARTQPTILHRYSSSSPVTDQIRIIDLGPLRDSSSSTSGYQSVVDQVNVSNCQVWAKCHRGTLPHRYWMPAAV